MNIQHIISAGFTAITLIVATAPAHASCVLIGDNCVETTKTQLQIVLNDELTDLDLVKQFPLLEELTILETSEFNGIVDLAPLADLGSLSELTIVNLKVEDLTPVSALTDLRALSLTGVSAPDYAPLASLSDLETLSLNGSNIVDLTPFGDLDRVWRLSLNGISSEDYSALQEMDGLQAVFSGPEIATAVLAYNSQDVSSFVDFVE